MQGVQPINSVLQSVVVLTCVCCEGADGGDEEDAAYWHHSLNDQLRVLGGGHALQTKHRIHMLQPTSRSENKVSEVQGMTSGAESVESKQLLDENISRWKQKTAPTHLVHQTSPPD